MNCQAHPDREASAACSDCGVLICAGCAARGGICGRCAADRAGSARPAAAVVGAPGAGGEARRKRGFRDLSLLAKGLALYVLIVAIIAGVPWNLGSFSSVAQTVLGWLGIAAGVLMVMARPVGWWLGLIWALAQALEVVIAKHALNHQCLYFGTKMLTDGSGVGLNLVGVILVALFMVTRGQFVEETR